MTALDALANDPELLARICDCGSGEARKQAPKAEGMTQEEAEAAEVEGVMDAVDDETLLMLPRYYKRDHLVGLSD